MNPISIHSSNSKVHLVSKSYTINILGGWHIREGGFSIRLTNESTGETIIPRRSKFRVQSIQFGKRSKRYYEVDIPADGTYVIEFKNPEELEVKRTNLFITSMLSAPISNKEIAICFSSD